MLQAQSYPGCPVRVIMPYPPGAVGDRVCGKFNALIRKELQRWPKLIRELGIQGGS